MDKLHGFHDIESKFPTFNRYSLSYHLLYNECCVPFLFQASSHQTPFLTADTSAMTQSNTNDLEEGLEQLSLHPTDPFSSSHPSSSSSSSHHEEPLSTKPMSAWTEVVSEPVANGESVPGLVSYFINVFDEPSAMSEDLLSHEHRLMREYQEREGVSLSEWQEDAHGKR